MDRLVYKYSYDFAVQGGAVATIPLAGLDLDYQDIIYGGLIDVITGMTSSGSPYLSLEINVHNDLKSSLIYSNTVWADTGLKAIIPVMTAGSSVKVSTASKRRPSLRIAGGDADAVTAGKFNLYLVILSANHEPYY